VDVTHTTSTDGSNEIDIWRVVFLDAGDVPSVTVTTVAGCVVGVEEFVKGNH
jgi:hypothetical protein